MRYNFTVEKLTKVNAPPCHATRRRNPATLRDRPEIQLLRELLAELFRVRRPASVARGHKVGDHPADVTLLRGVVIGAGMIARDRHGPGFMPGVETRKERRRILDVLARVKHFRRRSEPVAVEVVVDLHAAEVDQLDALRPRRLECLKGILRLRPKKALPSMFMA